MRHRWIIVGIALIAAFTFALSVWGGQWWSVEPEVTIGPIGARHCFGGECRGSSLGFVGGSDLWLRSALATAGACLIAMFALILVAGATAARRVPKLVARMALVAIATAAAAGAYFVAAFPGLTGAGLDRGFYMFAGAIVVGVIAPVLVLRAPR